MRALTKSSPFYFPLSRRTILSLFTDLFKPFTEGRSSTLTMGRGFGGGRALTKFMVMELDWLADLAKVPVSSESHKVIYVDPYELEEDTKDSFFSRIWFGVTGKDPSEAVRISELYEEVLKFTLERHIIIVIRGANYLSFSDRSFWGNVRSLMAYPEHIHFLFVTYEGGKVRISQEQFEPVRTLLNQNRVYLRSLTLEDIGYSIDRWGYTLEHPFRWQERENIVKVSTGKPALIKACCFAVAEGLNRPLAKHPLVVDVRKKYASSWIYPRSLSSQLSARERDLYKYLEARVGLVVSKDEIAEVLWSSGVREEYSDMAIAQTISRIRTKMGNVKEVTGKIETKYGQGYMYVE